LGSNLPSLTHRVLYLSPSLPPILPPQSEPWAKVTHAQVAFNVLSGKRLKIPINTDPILALIMMGCWEGDPKRRPNFEFIHRRLRERFVVLQNEVRDNAF